MHKKDFLSLSNHLIKAIEAHNSWKQHRSNTTSCDKSIHLPLKPQSLCEIQLDLHLSEAADIAKRMLIETAQGG